MERGWVKLWRKSKNSQVFKNAELWRLWTWCLMKANHEGRYVEVKTGRGNTQVWVEPGQFIFGRKTAAKEVFGTPSGTAKRMLKLQNLKNLDIQRDTHFSIVTIRNWQRYQSQQNKKGQAKEHPSDTQVTDKPQKGDTNKKKELGEYITQQAEALYSAYPKKADRKNSIKSIIKLLKKGISAEILFRAIENYTADISRKATERDYWIQSNNFFGQAARWEEFKDAKRPETDNGCKRLSYREFTAEDL